MHGSLNIHKIVLSICRYGSIHIEENPYQDHFAPSSSSGMVKIKISSQYFDRLPNSIRRLWNFQRDPIWNSGVLIGPRIDPTTPD